MVLNMKDFFKMIKLMEKEELQGLVNSHVNAFLKMGLQKVKVEYFTAMEVYMLVI